MELQEECTLLPQEECAREPQKVDVSCPTILDQCVSVDKPSFIQIHKLESCYNGECAIMHMNADSLFNRADCGNEQVVKSALEKLRETAMEVAIDRGHYEVYRILWEFGPVAPPTPQ